MAASSPLKIFLIGGHGKVALHFTRAAITAGHTVISQIRQAAHVEDLPQPSAGSGGKVVPLVSSLEELTPTHLVEYFDEYKPNVVVFSAGSGGKGGAERTYAVDRDGAIRVFDALEQWCGANKQEDFKRFLLVSAVDSRNTNEKVEWYRPEDYESSKKSHEAIGTYYDAKYQADKNLAARATSFPWFVLRPSRLLDDAGTGKVDIARHQAIGTPVPRQDVGKVLLALAELPKGQADGQMWNLTGGEHEVHGEVQAALERNRTDWLG